MTGTYTLDHLIGIYDDYRAKSSIMRLSLWAGIYTELCCVEDSCRRQIGKVGDTGHKEPSLQIDCCYYEREGR